MANFHLPIFFMAFLLMDYKQEILGLKSGNVYCRDNSNFLVDWWVIYKPPGDTGKYFESGSNFTYITSHTVGRWQPSLKFINENSMLQFTLAPLYKKLFTKHLAVMSYGEHSNEVDDDIHSEKSTAFGVMFANTKGGVWISHTIPGFPNLAKNLAVFPEEEYINGHMIMCLSVTVPTLNAISAIVRHTEPSILKFSLPDEMMLGLPEWTLLETAVGLGGNKATKTKIFNFVTREQTLRGMILSRSPEDTRCLYNTFAKIQGLVMDVYSNAPYKQHPSCEEAYRSPITYYSLRHINSISIKFPEQEVHYINNKTDRMSFGVSTAAPWQRTGQSSPQYWSCAGNIDQHSPFPPKGGLIACLNHYHIWLTFDNFKVKEPEC